MPEIKKHINKKCFLIILLTFFVPLLTFAQEPLEVEDVNTLRLQAESDAKKHADKDMTRFTPFVTGIGSILAGGMCGGMTGCLSLEYISHGTSDFVLFPVFLTAGSAISFLALLEHYYNNPPHPPIERLIGKPPEYTRAYAAAYGKKNRSKQLKAASAGAAIGCSSIAIFGYLFIPIL